MVYYIKAMAKGAAKMALPIAFAATALTPAMAANVDYGTTLKLVGPEKMAIGQTKEVYVVMDNKEANLSVVEFKVHMPEHGLKYVEGSFEKVAQDGLKDHTYKQTPTTDGFRVSIYNDNLVSMGTSKAEGGDTIAKFKVRATNYLAGQSLGLEIVDLSRSDASQVKYKNAGEGSVEGGEGDNSIGLGPVTEDRDILPEDWNVYVPGQTNENHGLSSDSTLTIADSTLTLVPNDTVYRKQHFDVKLKSRGNKIGGLSMRLLLPQGMNLAGDKNNNYSVQANRARTGEKAMNVEVITDELGNNTNGYVIAIMGNVDPIEGEDGVVLSFDVNVDRDNKAKAEDILRLNDIKVTSIFNTELKHDDIVFKVHNLHQEAYENVLKYYSKRITEFVAKDDTIKRVWDYPEVLNARNTYAKFVETMYAAGVMHINGNEAKAKEYVDAIRKALEDNWVENKDLYKEYVKVGIPTLQDSLKNTIPADVVYPTLYSRSAKDDLKATDFISAEVGEGYAAAEAAIKALADKVDELWNEKEHAETVELENASAEEYDGALLIDSAEVSALKKAAQKAIDDFAETLKKVNAETAEELGKLVDDKDAATNTDLAGILADAQQYVAELAPAAHPEKKGVFADEHNFPEIQEAVAAAEKAIADVNDSIAKYQGKEMLPFAEGINPVLDGIKKANEAIEAVKTVADKLKKENDDAYLDNFEKVQQLAIGDLTPASDSVQNTQTYKDAMDDLEAAIKDYNDLLQADDELGMCDKDSADLKKKYEAAKNVLDSINKAIDALNALNDKIDAVTDAIKDAEDKLEALIDPENNKYMENGEKTKDLVDAIKNEIEDLKDDLAVLVDDINNADDWEELLNHNGEVDDWNEALDELLKRIEDGDAVTPDPKDLNDKIKDAQDTYDKYHKQGDANMDGDVDPTDYATIIEYVLEEKDIEKVKKESPERFDQLNVDNRDNLNKVLVGDATAVINLYYYNNIDGPKPARFMEDAQESLTSRTELVDGVRRTSLSLNSANAYVAGQLDVVVPEGTKVTSVKLGSRAGSHDLQTNTLSDGSLRIVVSSMENALFAGTEGAVLYIETEGAGDLEFRNVYFAASNAQTREFAVTEAATTGIESVKGEGSVKEAVYNLGGRLVNGLKKGINIIRNANGETQKVIKK